MKKKASSDSVTADSQITWDKERNMMMIGALSIELSIRVDCGLPQSTLMESDDMANDRA